MNEENMVHKQNEVFSHKEEQNHVMYRKMDGTGDYHVK
jgi:hypothetical protein